MPSHPEPLRDQLARHWYSPGSPALSGPVRWLLALLSRVYGLLWGVRALWTGLAAGPQQASQIRVIAIGNLVAGGAGKTPCVIAIGQAFKHAGVPCGLLFRGYKSAAEHGPARVVTAQQLPQTPAQDIGDEAWLACWRTGLPIAVGKDRFAALAALRAAQPEIRVVLLDDGLQQRRLTWDQSILVTDGRGFGNGQLLPAGPLREPIGNLQRFSAWIHHDTAGGFDRDGIASMHATPLLRARLTQKEVAWVQLSNWQQPAQWPSFKEGCDQWRGKAILAAAGIAVPERFFALLERAGLTFTRLPLADHDPQTTQRIMQAQQTGAFDVILMTEKDAVKFFAGSSHVPDNAWALRRDAALDEDFLKQLIHGPQTS